MGEHAGWTGYDMVFLGRPNRSSEVSDDLQQRLQRPDYGLVAESLQDIGIVVAGRLLSSIAGQLSDLAPG